MLKRSGWRFPTYDGRDYRFPTNGAGDVPTGSLEAPFAVRDQKSVPCCVSCAVVAAMEILDGREGGAVELSPLFNYFTSRPLPRRLSGLQIRDGLKAATSVGVCPQTFHPNPFEPEEARKPPAQSAFQEAGRRRLADEIDLISYAIGYYRIFDLRRLQDWKAAIVEGKPIVIGFHITPPYAEISAQTPTHGSPRGRPGGGGGHACVVIGFDDGRNAPAGLNPSEGAFQVLDSRGPEFAEEGRWWLPYALIAMGVVVEAWVIARIGYQ